MYFEDIHNPFHFYDQLLVSHPCHKLQFNRKNTSFGIMIAARIMKHNMAKHYRLCYVTKYRNRKNYYETIAGVKLAINDLTPENTFFVRLE